MYKSKSNFKFTFSSISDAFEMTNVAKGERHDTSQGNFQPWKECKVDAEHH